MNMSFHSFKQAQTAAASVALMTSLLSAPAAWSHGGSHGSVPSRSATTADRPTNRPAVGLRYDPPFCAPHGGQLSKTIGNYYEVVYGPQETRVYVYDIFRFAKSARGIQGWAIMRLRSTESRRADCID